MSDAVKLRVFATVQAAKDQMEVSEIALVNGDGVETLLIKKGASTFQEFVDISAAFTANSFASMADFVAAVAEYRDHGLTDLEP